MVEYDFIQYFIYWIKGIKCFFPSLVQNMTLEVDVHNIQSLNLPNVCPCNKAAWFPRLDDHAVDIGIPGGLVEALLKFCLDIFWQSINLLKTNKQVTR